MSDVTREQIEVNIRAALGEYGTPEEKICLALAAVAQALLLQAEKQDELIEQMWAITSGGSKYLEVRTTEA